MATITQKLDINLRLVFEINEDEARALDALVGYGDDAFILAFKEKLGAHYMSKHEAGLRQFFTDIRKRVPGILERVYIARKALNE